MDTPNNIISAKFRKAVYSTQLTQAQVAIILGYSVSWVQKVSYGSITPPKRVLKYVFETLNRIKLSENK